MEGPPDHVLAAFGLAGVRPVPLGPGWEGGWRCGEVVISLVPEHARAAWSAKVRESLFVDGVRRVDAQLWLEVVHLRAAARAAADALATGEDTDVSVTVAQAYAAPVAVRAAEEALQLHAGIGMTWEHPVHLRLKRAKADSIAHGTAGAHREALADLVDLRAP